VSRLHEKECERWIRALRGSHRDLQESLGYLVPPDQRVALLSPVPFGGPTARHPTRGSGQAVRWPARRTVSTRPRGLAQCGRLVRMAAPRHRRRTTEKIKSTTFLRRQGHASPTGSTTIPGSHRGISERLQAGAGPGPAARPSPNPYGVRRAWGARRALVACSNAKASRIKVGSSNHRRCPPNRPPMTEDPAVRRSGLLELILS